MQAPAGEQSSGHGDGRGGTHLEEGEGLEDSCGAGCLPDGVHGQLGAA